jgi:hypothetical protein
MAASFFVRTFCWIHVITMAVSSPAATDPKKNPRVLYPRITKEMTTPGRMACERASPIMDIFLRTINAPNAPHVRPTIVEAIRALSAHGSCRTSQISIR